MTRSTTPSTSIIHRHRRPLSRSASLPPSVSASPFPSFASLCRRPIAVLLLVLGLLCGTTTLPPCFAMMSPSKNNNNNNNNNCKDGGTNQGRVNMGPSRRQRAGGNVAVAAVDGGPIKAAGRPTLAGDADNETAAAVGQRRPGTTTTTTTPILRAGIQNFRPVPVPGAASSVVYRCASTDVLGERVRLLKEEGRGGGGSGTTDVSAWPEADRTVFREAGLIFDLRSPVERNEERAQRWMMAAASSAEGAGVTSLPFRVLEGAAGGDLPALPVPFRPDRERYVVRLDVLDPARFMSYVDEEWLIGGQQLPGGGGTTAYAAAAAATARVLWYRLADGAALHSMRMDALNGRGLAGLNEAVLESGRDGLCRALQMVTLYREAVAALPSSSAVTATESSSPSSTTTADGECPQSTEASDDSTDNSDSDSNSSSSPSSISSSPPPPETNTTTTTVPQPRSSSSSATAAATTASSSPSFFAKVGNRIVKTPRAAAAWFGKKSTESSADDGKGKDEACRPSSSSALPSILSPSPSSSLPSDKKIVIHCVQGKDR